MIAEVIDDALDALDVYHEQDVVCASLLAVLDAVIRAMPVENERDEKTLKPPDVQPDPDRDLSLFEDWFRHRFDPPQKDPIDKMWREEATRDETGAFVTPDRPEPPAQEPVEDPKATRSQSVCAAILGKSIHFLTHESAFLRARVLAT